jgi:hypothetical protein
MRSIPSPETNRPRERWNAHEALTQGTEDPIPQADSYLTSSHPSVEHRQRALAVSSRQPASTANGRDRSTLPY